MKKVTKAIIPAAGLGTRFLPQTKAMPKEMLPIIDKPVIQYVVEEAVEAGITDIIIVTGAQKRAIEDHFDHQYELEKQLREKGKDELADELERIAEMANFIYLRQKGPYGPGVPVLNARHLIGDEPFLVLNADDMFQSKIPRAVQLVEAYEEMGGKSVISLVEIEGPDISKYGVIKPSDQIDEKTWRVGGLVEKPVYEESPSNLASVSGYVLTPDIIPLLEAEEPDSTGEIYLSTAINKLALRDEVYGRMIEGRWHDTGNKERYLEAIVEMALDDPAVAGEFEEFLRNKLS